MKQLAFYTSRNRASRLLNIGIAILMLMIVALTSLWSPNQAEAVTIVPGDTGIAQGALVDRSLDYQNKVLDATVASGAKWIRLDLWWFRVEETKGTYNWSQFDDLYGAAKAKGLNVLPVVHTAPAWASGCASVHCPPTEANVQYWKNFLTAAATRYSASTYGISTYEIWNEPNISRFYEVPNATTYVNQVLKPSYEAITAALPGATVLTGGTAPAESDHTVNISPWEFVRDIYRAGGQNYFHHIAHHPYTWPYDPTEGHVGWNSFKQMYENPPATADDPSPKSIRGYMLQYGDSGKKIWATEVGYPTNPAKGKCAGCVTEAEQKTKLTKVYNEWSKKDWSGKIFWYAMINEDPSIVAKSDPEANFGLKRADNTAKPAYDPFAKIVSDRYASIVKADGPRHYWKMGELSHTQPMKNEMWSGADGYYISSSTQMGTDGTVVGTPAPTFLETANNRAEVTYNSESIRLGGSAWTVEFSARRVGGTARWPGLMGRGDSKTANGWEIMINHDQGDFISFKRNNLECATAVTYFADGKSHHVALTHNNGTTLWYIDGVRANRQGYCNVTYPTPSTDSLYLWVGASPSSPGNNAIGHLAIYNKALTAEQVAAHAAAAVRLP